MSADAWAICPKCGYTDPDIPEDEVQDSEYAGSLRIDHEFYNEFPSKKFKISVRLDCVECPFSHEITEGVLP